MAKLPYNRVVNVNLSRQDAYPSRRGFGTPLILTNVSVAGKLDATNRTRAYGSMAEVAVDHASTTDFYKAAEEAFAQNPRPVQVKGGFITFTPPGTAAGLKTELDSVYDADNEWYFITVPTPLRDIAALDGLAQWVQAKNKIAFVDTNAAATQTAGDTTSFAARNKNLYDRTAAFYHTDANEFVAAGVAGALSTRNFDEADSHYTAKFKKIRGVAAVNLNSSAIQAITGFTPNLGQAVATGHMANTVIDIGGQQFLVEGSTLTPNVFIDEIHATDWIVARTEEEMLGILLNNARIPFTDAGMEMLASGPRTVMRLADRAGIIASDEDPATGDYLPAVEIIVPGVFDVPAAQRKARIAPAIQVNFRYSGAVHYTTINYTMAF